MTPLFGSETPYDPYQRRQPATPAPALEQWADHRNAAAIAKVRGPLVTAAQRIGLSDRRCSELQEQIDQVRDRLRNPPLTADLSHLRFLEDRLLKLEGMLHQERTALWSSLMPLATSARDAAVESMRRAWLDDVVRIIGEVDDA